jgi:transcriptional regulator with XRE-family HTH domain
VRHVAEVQQRFGAAVRKVRIAKGLSQERLAELARLDRTYISGLERGVRNPALSTQERIANALEVSLVSLLSDEDD